MASYYIYVDEQQQAGPYTDDQLREMLAAGQLTGDHYVWKEGTKDWVPLKSARLVPPPPPKLKIQSRANVPAGPNPLQQAQEARLKQEEAKFQKMESAMAVSVTRGSGPLGFVGRVTNAWSLMKDSFAILWADKSLLVLPLISSISALLVLIVFAVPTTVFYSMHPEFITKENLNHPIHYVIAFLFYFVNYSVIIFFNAAMVACVSARMQGQPCTVKEGLQMSLSRLPAILGWAAMSATVGLLLDIIDNAIRQRSEVLANIVRGLLGAAWTLIAFLALPTLVIERVGPITALKSSVQLLKKTWGEQIVGNVGFGVIFSMMAAPGFVMIAAGLFLGSQSSFVGGAMIAGGFLYFIVMVLVQSALRVVYQTALYYYAHDGIAPAGFSQEALAGSIAVKA
jgi:uncharacterized protein DUF6159/uncharacterized protein DUF4339